MLGNIRKALSTKNNQWGGIALFWCAISIFFLLVLKASFNCALGINDTIEHLQASWFVSTGKVPFRDFFEHHGSLLWYILAPLVKLFAYNANVIYVAKILAVILYFLCFMLMYHIIAKHLANRQIAKFSFLYLIILPIVDALINLRPDVFMLLCNLLSLNFFYNYLDTKRRRDLIISYVLLSVSFLFLQKSLFFILCFGLGNLWLLYRKKLQFKDCLVAGFVALIPLAGFGYYLYATNSFADYYFYNFVFNLQLMEFFGNERWDNNLHIYALLTFLIYLKLLPKDDKNLVLALIVTGQAFSLWQFAPYTHYFVSYFLFSAIGMGYLFQKLAKLFPTIFYSLYAVVICFSFSNAYMRKDAEFTEIIQKVNYLANPQLKVLDFWESCIYCQPIQYHWFGFELVTIIDDLYNNKDIDPNKLISSLDADYIYIPTGRFSVVPYAHNKWNISYNKKLITAASKAQNPQRYLDLRQQLNLEYWKIDNQILEENYEKVNNLNNGILWKRKNST